LDIYPVTKADTNDYKGANSGVGFSTASVIASASSNYHVILAGRNLEACEKAASDIKESGAKGSV
jgi:NADP-dependent 3-hydroxy acid dehydrogenase YdfG